MGTQMGRIKWDVVMGMWIGRSSGTSRLHAIKASLYESEYEGEEITVTMKIAQGMRRCAEFVALHEEAFQVVSGSVQP